MSALIFDCVVGVIILVSTIIALVRGFVREVMTIVGLVGAVAVTWFFGDGLKGFFLKHITSLAETRVAELAEDGDKPEPVTHLPLFEGKVDLPIDLLSVVTSYSTVFLGVFLALALLNFYISSAVEESKLTVVDRSMGAAFGLVRGVLLAALLYIPVSLFISDEDEKPQWIAEAKTAPLLQYSVDMVQSKYFADEEGGEEDVEKGKKDIKKTVKDMVEKVAKENAQDLDVKDIISGKNQKDASGKDSQGYDGGERLELDKLIKQEIDR